MAGGTATQEEIMAMKLNDSAAGGLLFGAADCAEVSDTMQDDWDVEQWPLGHVPTMMRNIMRRYVPDGAAGKTVLEDELRQIKWADHMQPYVLKDKLNRLQMLYSYCGEILKEEDVVKHLTQIILPKSLYGNAISTARTRALPNAVTTGKIIEVMQEIYNDLRT